MAKKKKEKIKNWVLSQQAISVLRRLFYKSPMFAAIKKANRRERKVINKDGSVSIAVRWEYQCKECGKWFPEKINKVTQIQIDHIYPVISTETGFVDWNTWFKRMFVGVTYWDEKKLFGGINIAESLQILCLACHKEKSKEKPHLLY